MEKISSIVPSSKRIIAEDSSDALPVRPGAPTFGRKEGRAEISDRVTMSTLAKDFGAKELADRKPVGNPREDARARIVTELSAKFFNTKLRESGPDAMSSSEKAVERNQEFADIPSEVSAKESFSSMNSPRGQRLDRLA
jgi:hypothetical protein